MVDIKEKILWKLSLTLSNLPVVRQKRESNYRTSIFFPEISKLVLSLIGYETGEIPRGELPRG